MKLLKHKINIGFDDKELVEEPDLFFSPVFSSLLNLRLVEYLWYREDLYE